jgi:hypothetical protein
MKKIIISSILLTCVIFLSGCTQQQAAKSQEQQAIQDQPEDQQQAVQSQPNTQSNTQQQQSSLAQPVKKQSAAVQFFKKIYYSVLSTVVTVSEQAELVMSQLIDDKLESINTPAPPIGSLTPVRDLRGTWKSSLAGKGLQVYGNLATGPGTTKIYENGDIELIIKSVENNIASGEMRFINVCATVTVSAPQIKPITTKGCTPNTGYSPARIKISGTRLDFGSGTASGVSYSMQGNYTTDIIYGTMTITLPSYGALKGEFNLMRVKQ